MATVRDANRHWTKEAEEFCRNITSSLRNILALGKERGFNDSDIYYMVMSEFNDIQLMDVLEERKNG